MTTTHFYEMSSEILPSAGQKRKVSADGEDIDAGRAIKHRASLACQSCRARKVRCDVLKTGSCCTNCHLDGMECTVLPSRRGKTRKRTSRSHAVASSHPKTNTADATPKEPRQEGLTDPEDDPGQVPVCVTFEEDTDSGHNSLAASERPVGSASATDCSPSMAYTELLTPEMKSHPSYHPQSPAARTTLPSFIAQLRNHIPVEDLDFLALKGAFNLPDADLQAEILRGYLFSVHPFMPMLDYRLFVKAMLQKESSHRISLLLFQAVMFAGLHSLKADVIHRLGFGSTKEAREVFFNRVRLLYEFDVEAHSVDVVQSLILMSSWYSKWDGRRDTWHWTGLAYDAARRMGLHREPTKRYASEKERRLRRRTWWSLYIRDRMITLGTRRVMRIRDDESSVAMLSLEDFDLEPMEDGLQMDIVQPTEEMIATAYLCIRLARLCQCIGRVVSSQYTALGQDAPNTVMIVSRRDAGRPEELESCDAELDEWNRSLEADAALSSIPDRHDSCSHVHLRTLMLTLYTTKNVLHRAQALQAWSESGCTQASQKASRLKVKDAARSLTKILQSMLHLDQVRYLGLIGVTALIAASLTHMLDVGSRDEDVRDASTFRLYQSLEVLHSLRNIYASADAASSFLHFVAKKARISIPALANGTASTPGAAQQGAAGKASVTTNAFAQPDTNGQALSTNGSGQHYAVPAVATEAPSDVRARQYETSNLDYSNSLVDTKGRHLNDLYFEGLSNAAVEGAFGDWNSGIEAEIGPGLEQFTFNYDFFADGFGLFDGQVP